MPENVHGQVVILGSGPAGWTAAIYCARAGLSPVVLTGLEEGGQLTTTTQVDNWPGAPDGIMGPDLMEAMARQAARFNARVVRDAVISVDFSRRPFILKGSRAEYSADAVIVATGASAKYLGLPSETAFKGRGVSACATCDGFFYRKKPVAVVGGGSAAIEEALYLSGIASEVHLIHRRNAFRAEQVEVNKVAEAQKQGKIILHMERVVEEVLGDDFGVTGVRIRPASGTGPSEDLRVDGVFIAIGHQPNTAIFKDALELDHGYIVTGQPGKSRTATSVDGVFAAGDVQDPVYAQAVTSAGSGCMAALDALRWLENAAARQD